MRETPAGNPWTLRFGARVRQGGGVEFRVWAPRLRTLGLRVLTGDGPSLAMSPEAGGEFVVEVPGITTGADYLYVLEDGRQLPDPVSRWQPAGVHGFSRVVDPRLFRWTDREWKGIPFRELVIYELHTATFTHDGTFETIISKLPHLKQLGVTAVELMPVAEFPGAHNWGYDGACLYAPHSAYGGPDGLKRLVDACHCTGLGVVLDVVYNHFGPEGNYFGEFAPCFTDRYRTPWGDAINFDGPDSDGVRRFFIDNALYWLTEYHVDFLRLDAIHAIFDFSAKHFLEELAGAFHHVARQLGRSAGIIAESDLNDVRVIRPRAECGYGIDAQWHDDFHHSLHSVLTGDRHGYLADFGTLEDLGKAVTEGFVYDGKYSAYRRRRHGSPSGDRPGEQFVVCIQNHDQIANACLGNRLSDLVSVEQQKLAAAVLLCSPFIPMIFMGQEYGETAPFLFFTSFGDPGLAEAVREGRRREYAAFYSGREFPDPQSAATFERSRLQWGLVEKPPHAGILRFYRDLISARNRHASLANCRRDLTKTEVSAQSKWLVMERSDPSGSRALLACNFADRRQAIPVLFGDVAWRLALWSHSPTYGGDPTEPEPPPLLTKETGAPFQLTPPAFSALLYVIGD